MSSLSLKNIYKVYPSGNVAVTDFNLEIEDKVYRAYGLLCNARLLSTDELIKLISLIRLGGSLGIIKTDIEKLNTLLFESGAYNISLKSKDGLNSEKRDMLRAELVRKTIGG